MNIALDSQSQTCNDSTPWQTLVKVSFTQKGKFALDWKGSLDRHLPAANKLMYKRHHCNKKNPYNNP